MGFFRKLTQIPLKSRADALRQQGLESYEQGDIREAAEAWQTAMNLYRDIKDDFGFGRTSGLLGVAHFERGDYAAATRLQQQCLDSIHALKSRPDILLLWGEEILQEEGIALLNLGNAYFEQRFYDKAIQQYTESLRIAKQIKDTAGEAQALGHLGAAHFELGDYRRAAHLCEKQLELAQKINDREQLLAAWANRGNTYHALGEYIHASQCYQQFLALARTLGDRRRQSQALGNLGLLFLAVGQAQEALSYFQEASQIAEDIHDLATQGAALGNTGTAYQNLGDFDKALEFHLRQLENARQRSDRRDESVALGGIGNVFSRKGDYQQALSYHQQHIQLAGQIGDRQGEAIAWGNMGAVYAALQDYEQAIKHYQLQLAITYEIEARMSTAVALNNLGYALGRSGNLSEAEKTLEKAIKILEAVRSELGENNEYKVTFLQEQSRTYRLYQQLLLKQGKAEKALEVSEQGRARAITDILAEKLSRAQTHDTSGATITLPQIRQLAQQQDITLVEYSLLKTDLDSDIEPDFMLQIWVIKPVGTIHTCTIPLSPGGQDSLSPQSNVVFDASDEANRPLRDVIVKIRAESQYQSTQALRQAYTEIILPIAEFLPQHDGARVAFVVENTLLLLPFAALEDEHGRSLIERYAIITVPSIHFLELACARWHQLQTNPTRDALVIGNPVMPVLALTVGQEPVQLASLPYSEQEAENIAHILHTEAVTGAKATKAYFLSQAPHKRFIHLATHGLLDGYRETNPPGAVILAPSGEEDGVLTAAEIQRLSLEAELVVLSACNTGQGLVTGDGIVGLSRALMSAGVSSTIVSLWSVPDAPTATLMITFYQYLQQGAAPAQALRQAMLTIRQRHPRPADWAAFVLIGHG